jgi:hypothetical protein
MLLLVFVCGSLCYCAVRRDLADVLGVLADVAMVSSPLVKRGYNSASMVGNQSIGRVSLPGQRYQPINRSSFSPGPWNCRCGLPNEMTKLVFASHGATQAPSACVQGAQKGLHATNRAPSVLRWQPRTTWCPCRSPATWPPCSNIFEYRAALPRDCVIVGVLVLVSCVKNIFLYPPFLVWLHANLGCLDS